MKRACLWLLLQKNNNVLYCKRFLKKGLKWCRLFVNPQAGTDKTGVQFSLAPSP